MITNQHILLDQKVLQGEGNIVSDMGEEKVMLNIENGKYYNLGEVGGIIWDQMKDPVEVNQIITNLLSRFHVERKECEEQILSFLTHLYAESLIEIVNNDI